MNLKDLKQMIEENDIKAIDFKYSDLVGRWYHITFPVRRLDYVVENGIPFDGSSIPGMKSVESGDMILMPDLNTANISPFAETPTIRIICSICDADTKKGFIKDPRSIALRAHKYMNDLGVADQSFWIPELEFYLFDEVEYYNGKFESGYRVSSSQNKEALPDDFEDNNSLSQQNRKGYQMDVPLDKFSDVRQEMVNIMEDMNIGIRYHHHEVGLASQQEIETELSEFPKIADSIMWMKDIIRNISLESGLSSTFMPKPMYKEAGNGLHFHMLLKKNGKNIFYKKGGFADLSDEALHFIGGILKHGKSLTALTNPSTNSFKRLLPGFEAPTKLFFGLANRCAAIRIPKYATSESKKRIEFRTGDATCNPYIAMSALLMAGLDGIKNKINPSDYNFGPFNDNIFNWAKEDIEKLESIPENLTEALEAFKEDNEYLLAGNVFDKSFIDSWITEKMKEVKEVTNRPHPYEMNLYYNM
jgi:glutamine synthetase